MKIAPIILGIISVAAVCRSSPFPAGKHLENHKIVVQEVLQTTNYTYLHVNDHDTLRWLAVPLMQAEKGKTYYYAGGLPMQQFESKELHRKFDVVLFLGGISETPITDDAPPQSAESPHGQPANGQPYTRKAAPEVRKEIRVDAPKDCISISELFAHRENYAGKTVKIKGEVTKYSPEIMNKNWIHLQDGTASNGKFDLTITSLSKVKTGDVVTFEGKVSLNKDFGYGYVFEVMMEDATLK